MCGRFSLSAELADIIERFEIENGEELVNYQKNYNVAPGQQILAVISDGKQNRAGFLKWGLVPAWAKEKSIGYKMINARAETVDQKPSFQRLLKKRRCLIIADGFYEWKQLEDTKQPMRMKLKENDVFAFAGLWDIWKNDEEVLSTCAIITTEPNEITQDIHNRMPVILQEEEESIWLNRTITDPALLKSLLTPYPSELMEAYAVSTTVNSAQNNGPQCIEPL